MVEICVNDGGKKERPDVAVESCAKLRKIKNQREKRIRDCSS